MQSPHQLLPLLTPDSAFCRRPSCIKTSLVQEVNDEGYHVKITNDQEIFMSNQDQQPPWGKKNKPQTPEEIVAQLINKLQDFFSDKKKPPPPPGDNQGPPSSPSSPFANLGKLLAVILIIVVSAGSVFIIFQNCSQRGRRVFFDLVNIPGQHLQACISKFRISTTYIKLMWKISARKNLAFETECPGSRPHLTSGL